MRQQCLIKGLIITKKGEQCALIASREALTRLLFFCEILVKFMLRLMVLSR